VDTRTSVSWPTTDSGRGGWSGADPDIAWLIAFLQRGLQVVPFPAA
jgi:hypothetical protein